MIFEDKQKCCFCGCLFTGFGNNPWPVSKDSKDRCCDLCNDTVVIPARIERFMKASCSEDDE